MFLARATGRDGGEHPDCAAFCGETPAVLEALRDQLEEDLGPWDTTNYGEIPTNIYGVCDTIRFFAHSDTAVRSAKGQWF